MELQRVKHDWVINTHTHLYRMLFFQVNPHSYRHLQAAKPTCRMQAPGRAREFLTPTRPIFIPFWCFSEASQSWRALKRKRRRKKMSLGRAIPHCPGPQKACFVPERAGQLICFLFCGCWSSEALPPPHTKPHTNSSFPRQRASAPQTLWSSCSLHSGKLNWW